MYTFRDALCLRYDWRPPLLPSHCVCGQRLTVEHALSCSQGGFPSIRHYEICDLTAELMSEVCYGVCIEPGLQPITEEHLSLKSANKEDRARLDIVAENFWGKDCHCNNPLEKCHRRQEMEKNRKYEERIREIEHGSFSPLVFTTAGGMGATATA